MVKKFVKFFRTVTMPTLSSCRDGKLVHSIATNMQLAGNQCRAMFQFHPWTLRELRYLPQQLATLPRQMECFAGC